MIQHRMHRLEYSKFVLIMFLPLVDLQAADDSCLLFKVMNASLTVEIGSSATFLFSVNNTCGGNQSALVNVNVRKKNKFPPDLLLCSIEYGIGNCVHSKGCTCHHSHQFLVRTRIASPQSQTWKLSGELQGGTTFYKMVQINVTTPPQIRKVTVQSNGRVVETNKTVVRNSEVMITCAWSEGSPPHKPRLIKNGTELRTWDEAPTAVQDEGVRHTKTLIHRVQCDDSGLIRCEATGAHANKTIHLLVKCAPQFHGAQPEVSKNRSFLQVPVHVYEPRSVDCELQALDSTLRVTATSDCKRMSQWTGTAPNFHLTVHLTDITSELTGKWRLELRNKIGANSVDFLVGPDSSTVSITSSSHHDEEKTTWRNKEKDTDDSLADIKTSIVAQQFGVFVQMIVIGIVLLVVIIVVILVCVLLKTRSRRTYAGTGRGRPTTSTPPPSPHTSRRQAPDAVLFRQVPPALPNARDPIGGEEAHIYHEISDDTDSSVSTIYQSPSDSSPVPNSTSSDGYLNPVVFSQESAPHATTAIATGTMPGPQTSFATTGASTTCKSSDPPPVSHGTGSTDYLNPIASPQEAAAPAITATVTDSSNTCLTTDQPPVSHSAVSACYLNPIASPNETTTLATSATVTGVLLNTCQPSDQQPVSHSKVSDCYLNPIASHAESATPTTVVRATGSVPGPQTASATGATCSGEIQTQGEGDGHSADPASSSATMDTQYENITTPF